MAEKLPPLDALAKAAKDRRDARSALRKATRDFAQAMVDHLRRGDEVQVNGVIFRVDNVTWWVGDGPPVQYGGERFLCPEPEKALLRFHADRTIVLGDPRTNYVDEDGVPYQVTGEMMYRAEAIEASAAAVRELQLGKPTDDELMQFVRESEAVVAAFARLADAEARLLDVAARALRGRSDD